MSYNPFAEVADTLNWSSTNPFAKIPDDAKPTSGNTKKNNSNGILYGIRLII
jgi:hypothetical protein